MKFLKLILIGLVLLTQNGQAQMQPYLVRAKCYGGSLDELGALTKLGPSLVRTPDNCILITGGTYSCDGDIVSGTCKGENDILLIKTDTSGNIIWSKNYGGPFGESGCATYVLPDSNYVLIGNTFSTSGDITSFKGSLDVIVLKINRTDGSIIWSKNYGGTADESPHCAVVDNNSVTIACHTRSYDGNITNKPLVGNNHDIWILKIDFNGAIVWQQIINGLLWDFPYNIIKSNGNYFVLGSTLSTDGNFTDNHGMTDTWLAKIDNAGTLLWKKCVGGSKDDNPATLIKLNDGNFLAVINSFSKDGDAANAPALYSKNKMFYVFKDDGSLVDINFFGGDIFADAVDIIQREDSSFLLSQHNGNDSVRISFMDMNYQIKSRISYGASTVNLGYPSGLLMTPGDYLYTIRQTKATTGQIIGNHGGYDFWVIKIKFPAVKIYPKPPSQPKNLQCNNINTSIKINWEDTGTTSRSTWIYRSLNDSNNFVLRDSVVPSIKQYTDGTVLNGKRYYYKVAGVNNVTKLYSNICNSRLNAGIDYRNVEQFNAYPNPFSETLTIRNTENKAMENIEVFNEVGQLVERKSGINLKTVSFDSRNWAQGVYYVKIYLSDSTSTQLTVTKK